MKRRMKNRRWRIVERDQGLCGSGLWALGSGEMTEMNWDCGWPNGVVESADEIHAALVPTPDDDGICLCRSQEL
jgi:hypothetical protein